MNYYRRWVGDYAKKTRHLSLMEHGVYTVLLDAYYSNEAPLPAALDRLYRIAAAISPEEQEAVRTVAETHFPIGPDGLRHNERADEELKVAMPEIEAARKNGGKGGRPKKEETQKKPSPKPNGLSEENPTGAQQQTQPEPSHKPAGIQPPSSNLQPPTPSLQTPIEKQRYELRDIPDSAGSRGAAALEELKTKALTLEEAKIPGGPQTAAGVLASVLKANNCRGNAFHPTVIEWAMLGITVDRLKAAIAKARQRPGKEHPASIDCSYLDPIVREDEKPAGDTRWRTDDDAAVAKGRELGLEAKRGEDFYAFRQRIGEALSERARRTVQ